MPRRKRADIPRREEVQAVEAPKFYLATFIRDISHPSGAVEVDGTILKWGVPVRIDAAMRARLEGITYLEFTFEEV